jgi:hypothetical protein
MRPEVSLPALPIGTSEQRRGSYPVLELHLIARHGMIMLDRKGTSSLVRVNTSWIIIWGCL